MELDEVLIDAITSIKDNTLSEEEQIARVVMDMDANTEMPEGVNIDGEYEDDDMEDNMSDDELLQEVQNQLSNSINGRDEDDTLEVALPLDYYFGRLPGITKSRAKDPNASTYVSTDVQMAIDSSIAELNPLFNVEEIVLFPPQEMADEQQAMEETQLINSLFFNEYNGSIILQRALKDCLLHRNASARVAWEVKETVKYEEYKNVNPLMLPQLLQPKTTEEEVEVVGEIVLETDVAMNEQGVQDIQQQEPNVSIQIKRTTKQGKPIIEIIKPEDIIVSNDHEDPTFDDIRFVAYKHIILKSELKELGYDEDLIDMIPQYNRSNESYSRVRTSDDYNNYSSNIDYQVKVFECFIKIDFDNDGIAELRKVVTSDNYILYNEPVNNSELISGVSKISPHRWSGISMFDNLHRIQDSKTDIMRSIVDGTKLSSNTRVGVVKGGVNVDDLLTSRTGGVVRMTNPNAIVPLPSNEVPQSSYQFIEFMNSARRDLGGASVDTAQTAQNTVGSTATAVSLSMGAVEAQNIVLAQTFAQTFIKSLFQRLHSVIRVNHPGEMTKKVGGSWITQTPSNWQERTEVVVTLGGSKTEKANKLSALQQVINYQEKLAMNQSILFSEDKLFKAVTEMVRLSGVRDPNSYFVDPKSEEGQQASQQKAQKEQQATQKQDQAEQMMMKAQTDIGQAEQMKGQASLQKAQSDFQMDQMQARLDVMESQQTLAYDYEKLRVETAVEMAKMEVKQEGDNEKLVADNYKFLMDDIFRNTNTGEA